MRFIAILILAALFSSGCSTLATKTSTPLTQGKLPEHTRQLAQLKHWQASGKIKVTVNGEPHSAAFSWQQHGDNYVINFFGPFGYGSSWLRRTSKGVTLESAEQPTQMAASPELLLQKTVGWQAPINELQYWLKGQPATGKPLENLLVDTNGAITQLSQLGWTIELSRQQQYGTFWLPLKLVATREDLTILIVIKDWKLN